LARAIDLAPEEGGSLTRRRVDPETLAAMDPSESDVIVLANVPAPPEAVVARLREHVERGGGLWIAAGDQFDPRVYAARFGDLMPARASAAISSEVTGPHAAPGNTILPAGASGLEQTRTTRRASAEDVDPDAETVLTFGDGTPAMLVARRGDGRVALLLTTIDDDWTDLPLRPGYLPMTVRLLRYLAPSGATSQSAVTPGTPVTLSAPAGTVRMRIVGPDGQSTEHRSEPHVEMTQTDVPGVYRVQVATRERELHEEARLAFVVAPPPEESDLTPGRAPHSTDDRGEDDRAITVVHRPIAPWFFLFVGIFAVIEAALRLRAGQLARSSS
jgi:hypothetical protein